VGRQPEKCWFVPDRWMKEILLGLERNVIVARDPGVSR
jgi:hypothetical protein